MGLRVQGLALSRAVQSVSLLAVLVVCGAALAQDQGGEFERNFRAGTEALRRQQLAAAVDAFERCTVLDPTFAEAWFNLGLARFQQNRLQDSVPLFEKSIRMKPGIRGANLFLGIARYRLGDYKQSEAALKREAQADPSNADALMWLGVVQLATGATPDAVGTLEKAARIRPKDVDILYHLGRAHMMLSKEIYDRMYRADPKSWRVHQVLAQSFAEAGRLDDAVKECQQAITLKPDEPGLHQQLGDIYDQQNNTEMAAAEYQSELKIDPHNTSVMYSLAVKDMERSRPADAVTLLTAVLDRAPDSLGARYQLGRAQAQIGDDDAAAGNLAAVVAQSDHVDAETLRQCYYQLSQLYRRLHRPEESRAALDSFVRLKQEADAEHSEKLQDKLKRSTQEQANR